MFEPIKTEDVPFHVQKLYKDHQKCGYANVAWLILDKITRSHLKIQESREKMSAKSPEHSVTILTSDQDTEQTGYSSFFAHTQSEQLGVRLWLTFWHQLWHDYNKLLNYRQPCSINNLLIQVDVWFRFPTSRNELLGLSDPSDKSLICALIPRTTQEKSEQLQWQMGISLPRRLRLGVFKFRGLLQTNASKQVRKWTDKPTVSIMHAHILAFSEHISSEVELYNSWTSLRLDLHVINVKYRQWPTGLVVDSVIDLFSLPAVEEEVLTVCQHLRSCPSRLTLLLFLNYCCFSSSALFIHIFPFFLHRKCFNIDLWRKWMGKNISSTKAMKLVFTTALPDFTLPTHETLVRV